MKPKEELEGTTNSKVYRARHKEVVANETGKCDRCPWHSVENRRAPKRTAKPKKHDHR
jgi:hypothetical protein